MDNPAWLVRDRPMIKPFVRRSSRVILETPVFRLREDQAEHPVTGRVAPYWVLENPDWVNMIALTTDDECGSGATAPARWSWSCRPA